MTIIEPFRIKSIEPLKMTTPAQREAILRKADFNPFLIHASDVIIEVDHYTYPGTPGPEGVVAGSSSGNTTVEPGDVWWTNAANFPAEPLIGLTLPDTDLIGFDAADVAAETVGAAEAERSMRLFAEQVMPRFAARGAAA